jgi:hypothetical protein
MMKKLIILFGIILMVFAIAVLALPLVFKGKINDMVLQKANEAVDAQIGYGKYRLTLLKSFPDLTALFTEVSVVGKGAFDKDTLAAFHQLSAVIDMSTLLKREGIMIESIALDNGRFQLIENESGNVNWDIVKEKIDVADLPQESTSKEKKKKRPLKVLFQDITISDLDFSFNSYKEKYSFAVSEVDSRLSGHMEGSKTIMDIMLQTSSINFNYDSVDYLKDGSFSMSTRMLADLEQMSFLFSSGDTKVNNLPLSIDGGFSMPNDSMFFDLKFNVPEISMKDLLEIIPDVFQKYMKDVQASGKINFDGAIVGAFYNETYPLIDVNFNLVDGVVKYPDLPEELAIHQFKAHLSKPEGVLELLTAGTNLQFELAHNPFSMRADFRDFFTDPHLDVAMDGNLDLETITRVLPLGDTKLKGLIKTDLSLLGNYSALEKNDFSSFVSKGKVDLSDFFIQNSTIPQGVDISKAQLELNNQQLLVKGLKGTLGRSDFFMKGQLDNLISYAMDNKVLTGSFQLNSSLFDVNEFMTQTFAGDTIGSENYVTIDSSKVKEAPLEFPDNMKLSFSADIAHLLYDKMDITNFNGRLLLVDQRVELSQLNMNLLGGSLKLNGIVVADGREIPDVDFDLDVKGFNLPNAYRDITMVNRYLPFAAKSEGEFSTSLKVKSKLASDYKMVLSSMSAQGDFWATNVKLVDAGLFSNLKKVIKVEKLKNLKVDDFKTAYTISNGNLNLEPFSTRLADQPITMGGNYNLGGILDFRVDATVDKELLSDDIQNMIEYIPGNQKLKKIDVGLNIKGDAKKPTVQVDTDKLKKQVVDQVKNSSMEDLEDAAKKLLKGLFK